MRAVNGCIIIFKWVWVILFKLSVNDWHFLGRYESSQETTIPFITSFLFITFAKFISFPQQTDVKNLLMCLFDCYFDCILSILWINCFIRTRFSLLQNRAKNTSTSLAWIISVGKLICISVYDFDQISYFELIKLHISWNRCIFAMEISSKKIDILKASISIDIYLNWFWLFW